MHMKWRQFGAHAPLFPLPNGFEVEFSRKTDPEDGMPLYEQLLFVDGKGRKHREVGAYFPVGQLEGDCSCDGGGWPCEIFVEAASAISFEHFPINSMSDECYCGNKYSSCVRGEEDLSGW